MLLRKPFTSKFFSQAKGGLQWQLARGQHAAFALEVFAGEELYDPAYSEPPKGTQAHRTDTFVREVRLLLPTHPSLHAQSMHTSDCKAIQN